MHYLIFNVINVLFSGLQDSSNFIMSGVFVIGVYLLSACRKVKVSVFDISGCESTLPVLFTPFVGL